jgi:tRNA nucleotidyltransferase (CCA-adding enzyme)
MAAMVANGEVDHLVPERVWQETKRALEAAAPRRFFEVLGACGALACLFPELERRLETDAAAPGSPLAALERATPVSADPRIRFAVLVHDLGRVPGAPADSEAHAVDVTPITGLCERLRIPNEFRDLAVQVARYHGRFFAAPSLGAAELVDTLEGVDAYRRAQRFEQFLLACRALYGERVSLHGEEPLPSVLLKRARAAALSTDARELVRQGLKGEAIKHALRERRIAAVDLALAPPLTRRTTADPLPAPDDRG